MADTVARRVNHVEGYYKRLNAFNTALEWQERELVSNSKKRKYSKRLQGIFRVEALLAVRQPKKSEDKEYLVKWDSWGSEFNSWEPESHILDKSLLRNFNKPTVDECVIQAHVELIRNAVEGGLTDSLQSEVTVIFDHCVFRNIFHDKGRSCGRDTLALNAEDFPNKYFPDRWDCAYTNKRLVLRQVVYPIHLRPFLGRSRQLYNIDGSKRERRWTQKLTITFRKKTC